MKALFSPRLWLFILGAIGGLFLLYVIVSASVQPGGDQRSVSQTEAPANLERLITGEMADFTLAFPPRGMPAAPFQGPDGESLTLADFKGRVVLVNFWATWCAPCLKELPSLDALQGAFPEERFKIIAVAADPRGPEAASDYLERLEITNLDLYADPALRLASSAGGAAVLPVSILFDAKGQEIGRLLGEADWTSDEAKALIRAAISRS